MDPLLQRSTGSFPEARADKCYTFDVWYNNYINCAHGVYKMRLTSDQLKEIIQKEHDLVLTEKRKRRGNVKSTNYRGKNYSATHRDLERLGFRPGKSGNWNGPRSRLALDKKFSRALVELEKKQGIKSAAKTLMDAKIVGLSLINKVSWLETSPRKKKPDNKK